MSSNRERYTSSAVSRRSSPADANNYSAALFQTSQGGITVLPPLSNIIPTPSRFPVPHGYTTSSYAQPRSTNPKIPYDLSAQALYGSYPTNANQFQNSFSYEIHDAGARAYSPQPYNSYPRSNTPIITNQTDSRRLPPLSTSPSPSHRWQQPNFIPSTTNYPVNNIRSPTASYPNSYMTYNPANQPNAYPYHVHHDHMSSLDTQGHPGMYDEVARLELRSSSPYGRSSTTHMAPPPPQPQRYTPPPVSPTSPEEPAIKKKRKRADAHQLKVLNDTYNRTAFPSTEERIRLAKDLDMSARSVQIWFQNKRQSMRQTNKQSSTVSSSSHHPFSASHQGDHLSPGLMSDSNLAYTSGGLGDALYLSGPSQEAPRSISSHSHHYHHSSSSHRLSREEEDRKPWSRPL
ncbi:hypothetical protein CVT24_006175 [Panaeolus cyanescens]|uniref:Homeobox domain-containing protein n=1 Tax=Panaeolus cyanescens TaxID=181874 RepID=A0A409VCR1_9AGAR|nr:hypothetical protein CVT24_006175 [Panaeolus cyanescens]